MYGTLYSMSMERITYILKDRIGVYEGVWKPFNDFIKKNRDTTKLLPSENSD